jgi:hypothetical protein
MKKRRGHSRRTPWFRSLFRKQKPTEYQGPISPSLLRDSSQTADPYLHESDVGKSRRKRSFWKRLFGSGKHKKHKTSKPLFIKPEEPEKPHERLKMNRRVMIVLNSTIMYLLAFFIIYLIYQMTVIFTASRFGISGVLYYYQVFWPIGNSSPLWFPYYKIILITGSGPFISLIAGLLFFRVFVNKTKNPATKLFFLWIALHGLNMFFGAFVSGVTTNDGFGYVVLWMHMNIVFRILFSFIFLFGLSAFGYHAARYFLETAQSPGFIKTEKRREFLLYQALIPAVLGAFIILLIRIPYNPPYQVIVLFTLLAATITAVFNKKAKPSHIRSFPKHHGRKLEFVYLLAMIILFIGFRFGLEHGLHFIIKMSMSVTIFGAAP